MATAKQDGLDVLIQRRDTLRDNVQRVKGRLDSARKDVAAIEAECAQRKVPPDKLAEAIDKLGARRDALVAELATGIAAAEKAVAPYLEET